MVAPHDSSTAERSGTTATALRPRDVHVLQDPARVVTLLDPERRRVMEALRERPDSASGLAGRLGRSRQRLNYHLRVLEDATLIEVDEVRQRRGFMERVMRPTAVLFLVDPGAADEGATERLAGATLEGDHFSAAHLIALAARTIHEVAMLRARAEADEKRLATGGLSAEVRLGSPAEFRDFVRELSRAVAGVVARFDRDQPGARRFRVVGGSYPAPARGGGGGRGKEHSEPKETHHD